MVGVLVVFAASSACSATQAAGAHAAAVTISPLPGTLDASPTTQISFRGVPASSLHAITVRGSRSGSHSGRLSSYATGTGASFLPARAFMPGEHVSVTIQVGGSRDATSFTVAYPYTLPRVAPARQPDDDAQVLRFHSRHDLRPPTVTVSTPAADPSLGDIFSTPSAGPGQDGPMIVDPRGELVWFTPAPNGMEATDLREQFYRGRPVLTWWQGQIINAHGEGEDVVENSSYHPIAYVHAGNGLSADLHDFVLTPRGTALITAYEPVRWNLSSLHGASNGLLDDCVIQEIDVSTGLVMFEWHALGHVPVGTSYSYVPRLSHSVFDWFHVNSIQEQANGDLLVDARNTWAAYLINATDGAVAWTLGGKQSSFALGPGVRFSWQHDAQLLPGNVVSLFDDEAAPAEASESRAINIALDLVHHTATLLAQYVHPGTPILSESQGNAQVLPNGDRLVGWGQSQWISEFARSGDLTLDLRLPQYDDSYRAYRAPWIGSPTTRPALAAGAGAGATTALYASWNGATGVASWRILTGSSPRRLRLVASRPRTGFETALVARGTEPFLAVQAVGAGGEVLGTSATVRR